MNSQHMPCSKSHPSYPFHLARIFTLPCPLLTLFALIRQFFYRYGLPPTSHAARPRTPSRTSSPPPPHNVGTGAIRYRCSGNQCVSLCFFVHVYINTYAQSATNTRPSVLPPPRPTAAPRDMRRRNTATGAHAFHDTHPPTRAVGMASIGEELNRIMSSAPERRMAPSPAAGDQATLPLAGGQRSLARLSRVSTTPDHGRGGGHAMASSADTLQSMDAHGQAARVWTAPVRGPASLLVQTLTSYAGGRSLGID